MPKVKIILIIAAIVMRPFSSISCGNEYYYQRSDIPYSKSKLDLKHLLFYDKITLPYWHNGFGDDVVERRNQLVKKINKYGVQLEFPFSTTWAQTALGKKVDFKLLSDFAWYELRLSNDKENAVKLLEALYQLKPDEYNVVANLGTGYELTGQNEKALEFIRKAVALNPASHFGSEWIHIRILEQKVKEKPDYTKIINLGADKNFTKWLNGESYNKEITPDSLMAQIAYQLHERISFIPEPDPIVGQLILDFADLVTVARSISEAKPFYRYAVTYDTSLVAKEKERLLEADGKMAEVVLPAATQHRSSNSWWIYIAIAGVVTSAAILYFIRRRKNAAA
jgi:tetratricopeptide (TPR) repeat protein